VTKQAQRTDPSGCWPTKQQGQLLRAALLDGEPALQAWSSWTRCHFDLDTVDYSSRQLLPLVFRNLVKQSVPDPLLAKLKGLYRQNWYRNRTLLHAATAVLGSFREAGIPAMALKGFPLILLYYQDFGARHLADCDILVPVNRATEAAELLMHQGWQPAAGRRADRFNADYFSVRHSHAFVNNFDFEFDLHWHPFQECCNGGLDADFWERSLELPLTGVVARAPSPTHLLLQVCVHGAQWCQVAHLRWVADVMVILRTKPEQIDWNQLLTIVRKHRLVPHLRTSLRYLTELLDAPVPVAFLSELERLPVSRIEQLEYRALTKPLGLSRSLLFHWSNYLRCSGPQTGLLSQLRGLTEHLKKRWDKEQTVQLPLEASRRLARRYRCRS
jgi:hypothetical protein